MPSLTTYRDIDRKFEQMILKHRRSTLIGQMELQDEEQQRRFRQNHQSTIKGQIQIAMMMADGDSDVRSLSDSDYWARFHPAPAPTPPTPQRAAEPFDTPEQRDSAIARAASQTHRRTRRQLAKQLGVDYSDLNKWKLRRWLDTKGKSAKIQVIENGLSKLLAEKARL